MLNICSLNEALKQDDKVYLDDTMRGEKEDVDDTSSDQNQHSVYSSVISSVSGEKCTGVQDAL